MMILHSATDKIVLDYYFFDIFPDEEIRSVRADEPGTADKNQFLTLQFHDVALIPNN